MRGTGPTLVVVYCCLSYKKKTEISQFSQTRNLLQSKASISKLFIMSILEAICSYVPLFIDIPCQCYCHCPCSLLGLYCWQKDIAAIMIPPFKAAMSWCCEDQYCCCQNQQKALHPLQWFCHMMMARTSSH